MRSARSSRPWPGSREIDPRPPVADDPRPSRPRSALSAAPARLPQLAAIDLDGTLLRSDGSLADRSVEALRALASSGCRVVLCTGRPPRLTFDVMDRTGVDAAIVYNGASRIAGTTTVHELQLDAPTAHGVLERARRNAPGSLLALETQHGWYLDDDLWELRRAHLERLGRHPTGVGAVERFANEGVIKILVRHPELDADALARRIGVDERVYATWSGLDLLEILHPGVNKRGAVARLAAQLGVARGRVAAFGDQRNDRELLAWAGLGVAMANAADEARGAADAIAPSNDDDGVAATIEAWLDAHPSAAPRPQDDSAIPMDHAPRPEDRS